MKTHFTQADIGKTFATSQDGVTATLVDINNQDDTVLVFWMSNTNEPLIGGDTVDPSQPLPSEADLLRKEIEELKASHEADLRTAVEMAREHISFEEYDNDWLYEPDEIIEKILKKPD
jgi:hypothetical protein